MTSGRRVPDGDTAKRAQRAVDICPARALSIVED
jgi:ferredoxin